MEVTGTDMKILRLSSQQLHHSLWSDTAVWALHWMQAEHMVSLKFSLLQLSVILKACLSVIWLYFPNSSCIGWLENCCFCNS